MNETPSSSDGFSVSFHWSRGGARRSATVRPGAWLRVIGAVALCAACYKAGRLYGKLEAQAAASAPLPTRIAPTVSGLRTVAEAPSATSAPGNALDEQKDVITPLNVRDPSALVMGPGATSAPPDALAVPAEPKPLEPLQLDAPKDPPESPIPPKRYKKVKDISPKHDRPDEF